MNLIFRNLIKLNRINLVRNYGINLVDNIPNYFHQREKLLIDLLKNHDFNDKQQSNVSKFIIENHVQLTDDDLFKIDKAVLFWKSAIVNKTELSKDGEELLDHLHVLGNVEPTLLFIDCKEMEKRINLVQKSGFCDSKNDVAKLFFKAPRAFFLQEWSDVLYKAYYIHNRIVDWILHGKTTCLYPHPIVKYPKVMELDYDTIKTRFLFAIKSGYKSKAIFQDLSKATPYDIFRDLLAIDFNKYLDNVCKGLTEEEFMVYKEMLRLQDKEEDKLFKDLSLMNQSIAD